MTGRFSSSGALRKWLSIACMPARNSANCSLPIATMSESPIAESSE